MTHERFRYGLILAAWTFIDFMGIWWVLGPGAVLTVLGLPLLSYVYWRRGRASAGPGPDKPAES